MRRSQAAPEDFADRVYEASILPEFWPSVLRDFATIAESEVAVLLATNGTSSNWVVSSDHYARIASQHYEYTGGHERTRRLMALRRPGFATDAEVFSEEEMLTLPLFRDLLIPHGLGRGVATAIEIPTGDTIVIHAEGDFAKGPLPSATIDRLNALRPHLARSALISARLTFERARTAVETLSGLGLAACAVGGNGTILVANAEFEADRRYWTTRMGGRIALEDRRADGQLQDALGMVASESGVRSLPLMPQAGEPPAVLHLVPVRRSAQDVFSNSVAILVLTKASEGPANAAPLLQTLFDLSPIEAETASRVAAGHTAEAIAITTGKSIHTVRNQIKSVLAKTGCSRQADLARLLAQLVPGNPARNG